MYMSEATHIYLTRIAAMYIIITRIGCTLITCDMYMCRLRHIHDPVLSSLKMEGIHLLYSFFPPPLSAPRAHTCAYVTRLKINILRSIEACHEVTIWQFGARESQGRSKSVPPKTHTCQKLTTAYYVHMQYFRHNNLYYSDHKLYITVWLWQECIVQSEFLHCVVLYWPISYSVGLVSVKGKLCKCT
jgi:hypothetical protein